VSVLLKGKLLPLLPKPLCSYICSDTRDSRTITAFGGHTVTVEGPYVFTIEILTHKLMHKFYVIDAPSPFIAGYDLVVAAYLIIDAAARTVYTRNPASNAFVSASPEPISPPATDVAVISSSGPGSEPPSPPPPSVPATLEPSTPASALAAHEPSDALRHPVVAPLTPALTTLYPLPRPSLLVCRLPIWTPQTLICQSICECSTSRHWRRLTCHPAWPPISGTFSSLTSMFLPGHRPTSASATCCSTILIQATLPPSGNHLVDPLWLRAQPRTI